MLKKQSKSSMFSHSDSSVRFGDGIHYATPIVPSAGKTTELDLVRAVLQMMQGLSSPHFRWDSRTRRFCLTHAGIYVTHLSRTSLHSLLLHFAQAATCLKLVDLRVSKLKLETSMPTLSAFASLASQWLRRLRNTALKEEAKMCNSDGAVTPTLLGLSSSLSSLCSAAEYLLQIVDGAIPQVYFYPNSSVTAAHILDYLYKKLDQVCLVQGGQEEAYQMVLHMFVGSLLPYIEGLDSWLFEGTLDDPFEELFFYADRTISVDKSEFWEKSYQLRQAQHQKLDYGAITSDMSNNKKEMGEKDSISLSSYIKGKEQNNKELQIIPLFIKEIAKSVVSAGKSFQLIQHVSIPLSEIYGKSNHGAVDGFRGSGYHSDISSCKQSFAGLTLSEIFCITVAALIGHGAHISKFFLQDDACKSEIVLPVVLDILNKKVESENGEISPSLTCSDKIWYKSLISALPQENANVEPIHKDRIDFLDTEEHLNASVFPHRGSFHPENPVITVCQTLLDKYEDSCKTLDLSRKFDLQPLNDEVLRESIFGSERGPSSAPKATNYAFGFHFGKFEYLSSQNDTKLLQGLFPFPTLLPSFQDDICISELLPFQKNSTLLSKVLTWIQSVEPRTTPLPVVILQDCLHVYIKKQVDFIGRQILSKLMNEWRLMDELAVLRAIYLLGSGDLLQHFLTVLFGKLDKGETWDDDFELNTMLQESIRNSADSMLLSAPDSLDVSITKNHGLDSDELPSTPTLASRARKSHLRSFGIDGLDSLKFTYKVAWPLELIANSEAIKKYNQVMGFLLKVKRAKFALDKTRRWMWKDRGSASNIRKRQWLVEQKLLHFVDAFHQYVMDRVYHSAWRELCEGMAAARSLDEVIEVHEAYLLSIQRQCFVVPDKLWALIASRINSILGLALDFYSIQQTLSSGGATSAMKARCEMEVDNIEKRFDDCVAFLLRVLSFRLNVGHFPHLADLVTRINYNCFYMSDGGNLTSSSGSEAASSRFGGTRMDRTN